MSVGVWSGRADPWARWAFPAVGISVVVAFWLALGEPAVAQAVPQSPKPVLMLTLVRVFGCDPVFRYPEACAKQLEDAANEWLQKAQPGVSVQSIKLTAGERAAFIIVEYTVPDWRADKPRQPAETPR